MDIKIKIDQIDDKEFEEAINISLTEIVDELNKKITKKAKKILSFHFEKPCFHLKIYSNPIKYQICFGDIILLDDYYYSRSKYLHQEDFNGTTKEAEDKIKKTIMCDCVEELEEIFKGLNILINGKRLQQVRGY